MAAAPNSIELSEDDDSGFVRQALANYLEDVGLPAYTPFHLLVPSEQSIVLRRAQTLKTASRA